MVESESSYDRVVLITDNAISRAMSVIATTIGLRTVVLDHRTPGEDPRMWFAEHPLAARDAVVLCDHDAPDALALLYTALDGKAGYVAMMASRHRAAGVFDDLRAAGREAALGRLHAPAGLDIGGKSPGEIALSVMAELVAVAHDRPGGSLRSS